MKKYRKVIAILMLVVSVISFGACRVNSNDTGNDDSEYMQTYYGCPNSKRVKKLSLIKRKG